MKNLAVIEATMVDAVAYRRADIQADSRIWIRPLAEFVDGRFEFVKNRPGAKSNERNGG